MGNNDAPFIDFVVDIVEAFFSSKVPIHKIDSKNWWIDVCTVCLGVRFHLSEFEES